MAIFAIPEILHPLLLKTIKRHFRKDGDKMQTVLDFMYSLIPTRLESIVGGVTVIFGIILERFIGGWSTSLETLLILMLLDYITGICAAWINPQLKLDSGCWCNMDVRRL